MVFNSLVFLIFFAITFAIYWAVFSDRIRMRNVYLLICSYIFYGYWDWRFLALIAFSSAVDYKVGRLLGFSECRTKRKALLSISICTNLGLLGLFKYYNFFIESAQSLLYELGIGWSGASLNVILPVGISFYTFQTLSYTIDVYRKKINPSSCPIEFFTYVSFFPQLVAGPIERASHLLPQFGKRHDFDTKVGLDATLQILWGFFKKVVVADTAALFVDAIFADAGAQSGWILALGAVLFAIQIYGDFSGYSDIAIGTARLFGFDLMKNFACPYFSRNIAEFWRRWHISLSTWFRDYVYIPMGGSKAGKWLNLRNVIVVFTVSGLWHGANWTFVVWGLLNGLLFLPLILGNRHRGFLDTVSQGRLIPSPGEVMRMMMTFAMTCICWVIFRADSLGAAIDYLVGGVFRLGVDPRVTYWKLPLSPSELRFDSLTLLLAASLLFCIDWLQREKPHGLHGLPWPWPFRVGLYLVLSIGVVEFFSGRSSFIYFQF